MGHPSCCRPRPAQRPHLIYHQVPVTSLTQQAASGGILDAPCSRQRTHTRCGAAGSAGGSPAAPAKHGCLGLCVCVRLFGCCFGARRLLSAATAVLNTSRLNGSEHPHPAAAAAAAWRCGLLRLLPRTVRGTSIWTEGLGTPSLCRHAYTYVPCLLTYSCRVNLPLRHPEPTEPHNQPVVMFSCFVSGSWSPDLPARALRSGAELSCEVFVACPITPIND